LPKKEKNMAIKDLILNDIEYYIDQTTHELTSLIYDYNLYLETQKEILWHIKHLLLKAVLTEKEEDLLDKAQKIINTHQKRVFEEITYNFHNLNDFFLHDNVINFFELSSCLSNYAYNKLQSRELAFC